MNEHFEKPNMRTVSTKEHILDAAEELFSEHGYENVSMRNITELAKTNIASVNYHFQTKLGLLSAVFKRRAHALNKERLQLLQKCVAEAENGEVDIKDILNAFLEPSLQAGEDSAHGVHFRRIMGQMSASPNPEVRQMLFQAFDKVSREYMSVLRKACPGLSKEEFYWRVTFLFGAMMYVHSNNGRIQSLAGSGFDSSNMKKAIEYMVPFFTSGMQQPPIKKP